MSPAPLPQPACLPAALPAQGGGTGAAIAFNAGGRM